MYTPEVINYLHVFATPRNGHDVSMSLVRLNIGIGFDWLRLSPVLHLRNDERTRKLFQSIDYKVIWTFPRERAERFRKSENTHFLSYFPVPQIFPFFVLLSATYSSLLVRSRPPLSPLDLKSSAFHEIVIRESHKFVSNA